MPGVPRRPRMATWLLRCGCALCPGVLLLSVAACGPSSARSEQVAVLSAQPDAGGQLWLYVASCHGDPNVRVEESGSTVRVAVRSTVDPDVEADCADGVAVQLKLPLDGRTLLDAGTGRPVPVSAATRSP
jgi:hypothetical protein